MKKWLKEKINMLSGKLENSILSNKTLKCSVVFGPVRSRRLGLILGINNVKATKCSYNCIYCPSGKTSCCSISKNSCLSPYEIYISVRKKLEEISKNGKKISYIAYAGSGLPTLDSGLSKEILLLREFGYKIAVFTNSSMLWDSGVQEELMFADYVSLKLDTMNESTWIKLNRSHQRLDYNLIIDGIRKFANKFNGTLTTETMFIKNVNDNSKEITELSKFLNSLKREASYFMTPMYPPAESYVEKPEEEKLKQMAIEIKEKVKNSILLCCDQKEELFSTDDFENELLGLLAIHPVGVDAVTSFIKDNEEAVGLNKLIKNGIIKEIDYYGKKYLTKNSVAV